MSDVALSVVIPVFNEEENLAELIERCRKACATIGRTYEIVLVDDGSVDRSTDMLKSAALDGLGDVVAVLLNRNYGQHAAVMAGLAQASGDTIVTLDADLQNPPEEIPRLVAKIDEGFDVVGTIRENRQDSLLRRLPSRLVNTAVRKATGVPMSDYGCMLRAYRRSVVDAVLACRERSTFIPVLANSFASKTTEIPVRHAERAAGTSKYGLWKLVNLQFDLLTSMTAFPLRLLSIGGGLMALLGILGGLTIAVLRLIYGAAWAAEGVLTGVAILFVFTGVQLFGLGLIGEYLSRVYDDVRERPRYVIQELVDARRALISPRQPSVVAIGPKSGKTA